MKKIDVKTNHHAELLEITKDVQALIPQGFNGICHVFCKHTTAGLTINENADPDVKTDFLFTLDKLIPWDNISYMHAEGNSAAHVKASLMGFSVSVPVEAGKLDPGTWQGIYFCEFDGPRARQVSVTLTGGLD